MSFLFGKKDSTPPPVLEVQLADRAPTPVYVNHNASTAPIAPLSTHPPHTHVVDESFFALPDRTRLAQLFDVGILRDTLAPALAVQGGVALVAYGVARATDNVAVKDVLFPVGLAANAWYAALGRRLLLENSTLSRAASALSWPERLLLFGATAWSLRRTTHALTRQTKRNGADDPAYTIHERTANPSAFWTKVLPAWFAPDALAGALVALPFTAPFHHQGAVLHGYSPPLQALAVALFSAGFALEVLADAQRDEREDDPMLGGLVREGVWSLVRHPDVLGSTLVTASFPLLLYASDMLNPVELLALAAPLGRYLSLPHAEAAGAQDPVRAAQLAKHRETTNALVPRVAELQNPWLWSVVGAGVVGLVVERALLAWHLM